MPKRSFTKMAGPNRSSSKRRRISRNPRRRFANAKRRFYGRRIPKSMSTPVPFKAFKKLFYTHTGQITCGFHSTVPMTGYQLFRVNSIFDPDYTGVGAQPLWADQFNLLYGRYRVHGMKYKLTVTCADNNRMTQIALCPAVNATLETTWQTMAERSESRVIIVPPVGATPKVVRGYIPTGRIWGLTKQQMKEDEDFIALFGTNPTKTTILQIYGVTSAASAVIDFKLDMTFLTELIDRVKIGGS